jgi:hypothetical protein
MLQHQLGRADVTDVAATGNAMNESTKRLSYACVVTLIIWPATRYVFLVLTHEAPVSIS